MKMIRTFVILFSALFLLLATTSCTPAGAGTPGTTEALQQTTAAATTAPATTETPTTEPVNPYEAMYNKWVAKGYENPHTICLAEGAIPLSPELHAAAQSWTAEVDQLFDEVAHSMSVEDRQIYYKAVLDGVYFFSFVNATGHEHMDWDYPLEKRTIDLGRYQIEGVSKRTLHGVYKNGVFYEIQEAYDAGVLTGTEIDTFYTTYQKSTVRVAPREGLDPLPGIESPEALG